MRASSSLCEPGYHTCRMPSCSRRCATIASALDCWRSSRSGRVLIAWIRRKGSCGASTPPCAFWARAKASASVSSFVVTVPASRSECPARYFVADRSEEHTSELQSRFDLVCRLLLEKKKHHTPYRHTSTP